MFCFLCSPFLVPPPHLTKVFTIICMYSYLFTDMDEPPFRPVGGLTRNEI